MESSAVFYVEKPFAAHRLAPYISAMYGASKRRAFAIVGNYLGLYRFNYPHGLHMTDFPLIREPIWTPRIDAQDRVYEILDGKAYRASAVDYVALLKNASSITFAADPDASAAIGFHTLLSQTLGQDRALERYPAIIIDSFLHDRICKALEAGSTTEDEWFKSVRNAGIARRFFDYNYNLNAMPLFGATLRSAGCTEAGYLISKYSLQILYALRDSHTITGDYDLLAFMAKWRGTGRYSRVGIGSAASRCAIIDGLRSSGLIRSTGITPLGEKFLGLLHPDCRDLDIPGRLAEWENNWPSSKSKIERYLRTFFGKQKAFNKAKSS